MDIGRPGVIAILEFLLEHPERSRDLHTEAECYLSFLERHSLAPRERIDEWRQLLQMPDAELKDLLSQDTEHAAELRARHPFDGTAAE